MGRKTKRYWSCTRKVRHNHELSAYIALMECKTRWGASYDNHHVYECKWCGGWHIGSDKKGRYE